jgi:hypothetical protein
MKLSYDCLTRNGLMTIASDNPPMRHELGISEVDRRELSFGKRQNIWKSNRLRMSWKVASIARLRHSCTVTLLGKWLWHVQYSMSPTSSVFQRARLQWCNSSNRYLYSSATNRYTRGGNYGGQLTTTSHLSVWRPLPCAITFYNMAKVLDLEIYFSD